MSIQAELQRWRALNVRLLRQRFDWRLIRRAKRDLATRGWPDNLSDLTFKHFEYLLSRDFPASAVLAHRIKTGIEHWLYYFSVYQFARELGYVDRSVPLPIALECRQLMGFTPVKEFVRSRPLPLVEQLFIDTSGDISKPGLDWDSEIDGSFELQGIVGGCIDEFSILRSSKSVTAFIDLVMKTHDQEGLYDLLDIIDSLPDEIHLPLQEYLDHYHLFGVVGLLEFSVGVDRLHSLAQSVDKSMSERVYVNIGELFADMLEGFDQPTLDVFNSVATGLMNRGLLSHLRAERVSTAIQDLRSANAVQA